METDPLRWIAFKLLFPTLLGSRMNGNKAERDRFTGATGGFPLCWEAALMQRWALPTLLSN